MEFSSFFFHLLFFGLVFQLSNTIVSSTKVAISAQNAPTDKFNSLTKQIPSFDSFARTFNKSYPTYVKPAANELADIDVDDVDGEESEDEKDVDIGKRLVQQRIKRDTDDDTDDDTAYDTAYGTTYNTAHDTSHDTDDDTVEGPMPEDMVYIDHRQFGCLAEEPRNQGDCRASYAFATISFYEWLHCTQTGEFKAFSEQYVVDCSHRHGNRGCSGGYSVFALNFIKDCGLEFREDYPYTGSEGICPHNDRVRFENMGDLRIEEHSVYFIPLDKLEEYLVHGPIIVNVEINNDFLSYAEGVDDNEGYRYELLHNMLLIGHGRENSKEYWLFRNSYFAAGGDGLYKLNKNVNCLRGATGLHGPLFG